VWRALGGGHNPSVRPVIVAANWKMNTTPHEAGDLAARIVAAMNEPDVVRVICPPFVGLRAVRDAVAGTDVDVGAQNVHWEQAGAYTGEISAAMVVGLATWALVGHSERRRDQMETDERIGQKLRRCQEVGIRPILCVGERLEERESGRAESVVRSQIEIALTAMGQVVPSVLLDEQRGLMTPLIVAYEPVWAIGTGRTARGQDAAAMAEVIRATVTDVSPELARGADLLPVLYGGSVTSASVGEFLAEPSLDGALVGGASLKVDEMAGIVASAAVGARARKSAGQVS
jgi:triosephosphate isomerase (TIM)